jgi:endoglucanase
MALLIRRVAAAQNQIPPPKQIVLGRTVVRRREFSQAAAALAALSCLRAPDKAWASEPGAAAGMPAMGTNLSGMEWARPGLRYGLSSEPNIHFSVPRAAEVAYLAACGFRKNRLPIQWELLQPMLHDTPANAAAQAAIGKPGAFHAGYESFITGVLDAHAAAGIQCIIDCHNYCRYQDFRFQADGTVAGLTVPPNPLLRPYTTDKSQVQVRIFSLAPGATLTQSNFNDFWTRAAARWQGHPGLAGYGLMNEPHDMPRPGELVESSAGEDLTIWPTYAKAAIAAIRTVDALTPIYVGGNGWSSAMGMASLNPGFPLTGPAARHLIYEVHLYLDASNSGMVFDLDTEVAKGFSAGFGRAPIHTLTGLNRLRLATDWAKIKGVKLALTEVGMPIDDARWQSMFKLVVNHALKSDCEVFSWMGGNHWPIRNYAINHVPGWHQNKTLESAVSGVMKAAAGLAQATLFDDGAGSGVAQAGVPLTITLYARGALSRPVKIGVAVEGKGTLSESQLTLPTGANGKTTFSYTPAHDEVALLSYRGDGEPAGQLPPPRQIFSLANPVAHAASSLTEAALAIIARYSACKWVMADGFTDYVLGAPAAAGQSVRAIADSGYGSSPGNAMEMLIWINTEGKAMGQRALPVMRQNKAFKSTDHSVPGTFGFWCKKSVPEPGIQPRPLNRVPYNLDDAHFVIAALSVATQNNSGLVFQASKAEENHASELGFSQGQPRAQWIDAKGRTAVLTSAAKLPLNRPAVLAFTSAPGAQTLRVNAAEVARGNVTLGAGVYAQMLVGGGYRNYYPQAGFRGNLYAVITGKGAPTAAELGVLENYLGHLAGLA